MMHRVLVGGKHVDPVAFWSLPPGQCWWILNDVMPPEVRQDEDERGELLRMLREAQAKERAENG